MAKKIPQPVKPGFFLITVLLFFSCSKPILNSLYTSDKYTITNNKVTQGTNVATVISPTQIQSNYVSTASSTFSRTIKFKFSINEKDIEMLPGKDHFMVINDQHETPVITFGKQFELDNSNKTPLPVNYKFTFRVDMSDVIKQFNEKGYYTAFDGSKIAKSDFKGFFIAGNAEPLSWDFVNLEEKNLKLTDADGDNIYEITVVLNPFDASENTNKEWKLSRDISKKPSYTSNQPIVDALYNMSTEEALIAIEPDSTFRTGTKWGGVWTRDISYSIILAFAYQQPDVAKISLMKKVKRNRIIQDTGSGGSWPISSDRTVWAIAAWEVYKTTGDMEWLKKCYPIIKNTLDDDYKTIYDPNTGLFSGESSFLDWREQTYPKWMSNMDIYNSKNLGTNAVHYQAHLVLSQMAKILGEPNETYIQRARKIKEGMNKYLWNDSKGYYAQYLYGKNYMIQSDRFEALGESLSILFGIADEAFAKKIISKSPVTDFGVTCIYPQIPDIPPYHNDAIWPFVQSYWNLAAAKAGNEKVLNQGLASIYRAGALFLTNYENFVAGNGDFVGTEINSDHMLWSMAGNLAMVNRVFIGMNFQENGIEFQPAIPAAYNGTRKLSNFKYQKANLNITVSGFGNKIKSFKIDGKPQDKPFVNSTISGNHDIEILMDNNPFEQQQINLVANVFSIANPIVKLENNQLTWETIKGAVKYKIYKNGKPFQTITANHFNLASNEYTEYAVSALDANAVESFIGEPVLVYPKENEKILEIEKFLVKSNYAYINFSGEGFVALSKTENKEVTLVFDMEQEGNYSINFRYSNGNGPWNTDNKCAIRSLYVNNDYTGAVVFPQRGNQEWSDWGNSNTYRVQLRKGQNTIKLIFEDWNNNMNVDENTVMLDYMKLIKN